VFSPGRGTCTPMGYSPAKIFAQAFFFTLSWGRAAHVGSLESSEKGQVRESKLLY
jgi:hypothetical protein